MEQWSEERVKLGQQAFWLAVGKDSKEDSESIEKEGEGAEVRICCSQFGANLR